MNLDEVSDHFKRTIEELNVIGFTILNSVFIDENIGYRLEEITPDGSSVVVTDKEPFKY